MPMPGATAKGSLAYRPIIRVIVKQIKTVAVSVPLKVMPVPGVDRIEGLTITMYDIVKKVVMPAIASVRMFGFATWLGEFIEVWPTRMNRARRVYASKNRCARNAREQLSKTASFVLFSYNFVD